MDVSELWLLTYVVSIHNRDSETWLKKTKQHTDLFYLFMYSIIHQNSFLFLD